MKMAERTKKSSININKSINCKNCPPYSTTLCIANFYQPVLLVLLSSIKISKATWSSKHLLTIFQPRVFSKRSDFNFFTVSLVVCSTFFIFYCSHYQQCNNHHSPLIPPYTSCIIHSFVSLF